MNTTAATDRRAKLVKLIQIARRDLGMDEPTYRTVLLSAGKASSTKEMAIPMLEAVLERMKASGFKVRPKGGDRSQSVYPEARKVRALWLFLHHLGEVRDPSETALAAYVKRMVKVDDLRWARGDRVAALGQSDGLSARHDAGPAASLARAALETASNPARRRHRPDSIIGTVRACGRFSTARARRRPTCGGWVRAASA